MTRTASIKPLILKEAASLFSKLGYERTSMREIAERVGVSKPAIYYHFSNKQSLFEELVSTSFDISKKRIGDIAESDCDPVNKLIDLAKGFFASTRNNPEVARFIYDLTAGNIRKDIDLNHRKVFSKHQEWFNQILDAGKDQGIFKKELNNFSFIMIYIGTINMYTISYLNGEISDLNDDTAEQIIGLLLEGIKN